MTRAQDKARFIERTGWAKAKITPLAGDASQRRYDRLTMAQQHRILMDAPRTAKQDVGTFVTLANMLHQYGYSAPKIYAQDQNDGFLLLEDLGDNLYTHVLRAQPELSDMLYHGAVDVLLDIHKQAFDWHDHYNVAAYARELHLLTDWYLPAIGRAHVDAAPLRTAFQNAFDAVNTAHPVLVLRDYHAENLLWLPSRNGLARVGLLDFQDALIGHPAYDLVSLLEDARRDTDAALRQKVLAYYLAHCDRAVTKTDFVAAYNLLGAQRNLKILGIFARLSQRDKKPRYIQYMPRVWDHLQRNLQHPACDTLRRWVDDNLPAPTPEIMGRLQ